MVLAFLKAEVDSKRFGSLYQGVMAMNGLSRTKLIENADLRGFIEDISVTDDDGKVLALCEVKGKKGGVNREHINQVDSERKRNGLTTDTLGLLIINDHMDDTGYAERKALKFAREQIDHATALNVLIIRTIDLLLFMLEVEEKPDRKKAFWTKVKSRGSCGTQRPLTPFVVFGLTCSG
jgi:hypothetical protein